MFNWPKDTTEAKIVFYGDFRQKGWQDLNLTHYIPPFKMYYEKKLMSKGILVHKKIIPALELIFADVWTACGYVQDIVDKTGMTDFGGCFNIRKIAGSDNYSNHSWACALDLSPSTNGFNQHPNLANVVIDAFDKQNFRWGGRYKSGRTDPMHFEAVS